MFLPKVNFKFPSEKLHSIKALGASKEKKRQGRPSKYLVYLAKRANVCRLLQSRSAHAHYYTCFFLPRASRLRPRRRAYDKVILKSRYSVLVPINFRTLPFTINHSTIVLCIFPNPILSIENAHTSRYKIQTYTIKPEIIPEHYIKPEVISEHHTRADTIQTTLPAKISWQIPAGLGRHGTRKPSGMK